MHRLARVSAAIVAATLLLPSPGSAQAADRRPGAAPARPAPAQQGPAQPPHAWLFGTWTGGLFPPPTSISAEVCLSQPVVIFTRDLVMRAQLTDQLYVQRLIETALTTTKGVQFRFASVAPAMSAGLLLRDAPPVPPGVGFGCEGPNELAVERHGENQITFPNCGDFPYPLLRCPSR